MPFFRMVWDGCALLVRPSRIPCWISKITFALGSYEFLAMLEGKTRKAYYFRVQSGKITVWDRCFPIKYFLMNLLLIHFTVNFLCFWMYESRTKFDTKEIAFNTLSKIRNAAQTDQFLPPLFLLEWSQEFFGNEIGGEKIQVYTKMFTGNWVICTYSSRQMFF